MSTVKVSAVQFDPKIGEKERNLNAIIEFAREASARGAQLIVFPECALTGYCFESADEARPFAETVPGPSTDRLSELCRELDVTMVVGLLEREDRSMYNAAALISPNGVLGCYRKIHLPCLGADRFVALGNRPFKVYETPVGRIGVNICYDGSFPESARVMALDGADILTLPTNWPQAAFRNAKFIVPSRALENRIYYIAADRCGVERDWQFYGHSLICNVDGDTLAEAGDNEEIIYAEVDVEKARAKHIIHVPGEYELDRIHQRRPEFYGRIVQNTK